MLIGQHFAVRAINDLVHPRQRTIFPLGDENYFIAGNTRQIAQKMQILAGEVLVDKKNFHGQGNGKVQADVVGDLLLSL